MSASPSEGRPLLDIFSFGRPGASGRFTPAQIEQIRRTVGRVPEVMVKVTGGGTRLGAVAADLAHISRKGELSIETDEGERIASRDAQKALLNDWHLDLTAGKYRAPRDGRQSARHTKLVHNIVSMPSPTPPEKVLAAARKFAREKFSLQHRYALVLHTDQQRPHVHMVVKAESEERRRLHIDKAVLRVWREDFAQLMRGQGIAANATSRFVRGQTKGRTADRIYRAKRRGDSTHFRNRVTTVAKNLTQILTFPDASNDRLLEARARVTSGWLEAANALELQGETILATEMWHFASGLPLRITDNKRLAEQIAQYLRVGRREAADHFNKLAERTR